MIRVENCNLVIGSFSFTRNRENIGKETTEQGSVPNIQKQVKIGASFHDMVTIFTASIKIHQKYIHVLLHTNELSTMVFIYIHYS